MNHKLKSAIYSQFNTQRDFAKAIGIHEVKLTQVIREHPGRSFTPAECERASAALGIDVSALVPDPDSEACDAN